MISKRTWTPLAAYSENVLQPCCQFHWLCRNIQFDQYFQKKKSIMNDNGKINGSSNWTNLYTFLAWVQKATIGTFCCENFWQVNYPQKLLTNPSARKQKLHKTRSEVQMVGFVMLFFAFALWKWWENLPFLKMLLFWQIIEEKKINDPHHYSKPAIMTFWMLKEISKYFESKEFPIIKFFFLNK